MVGSIIETFFNKSYVIIKLNIFFVGLALTGGIILGTGPAFYAVLSLFRAYGWQHQELTYKRTWQYYKKGFIQSNKLSLGYLVASGLLLFNLLLAVQQTGLLFLSLSLFIGFALVVSLLLWQYSIQLEVCYVVALKNNIMIALSLLFANIRELLVQIGGMLAIILLTSKMPALLLFGSFACGILWLNQTMKARLLWLQEQIS